MVGLLDEAATGTWERQATADTHHHAPLSARGRRPGRTEVVVVVTIRTLLCAPAPRAIAFAP